MRSRKAMQLQTNFLVVLIISIFVFGAGITIFTKVINKAKDFNDMTDANIAAEIAAQQCGGNDLFKVVDPQAVLNRKESKTFYWCLKNNLGQPADFKLSITSSPAGASWPETTLPSENVQFTTTPISVANKASEVRKILVTVPKSTVAGTYVFNVVVCTDLITGNALLTQDTTNCVGLPNHRYYKLQKIYITVE